MKRTDSGVLKETKERDQAAFIAKVTSFRNFPCACMHVAFVG